MQSDSSANSSDTDTINLSEIEDAILIVLPTLGAAKLGKLIETLVDPQKVGVASVSNLRFVLEGDIRHLLTAIEVRKLISSRKSSGKPWEATWFQIAVGGQITTTIYNPSGSLSVWFSSFYIFNLEYPPKASATIEVFQRCIAGINPPDGRGKSTNPKENPSTNWF